FWLAFCNDAGAHSQQGSSAMADNQLANSHKPEPSAPRAFDGRMLMWLFLLFALYYFFSVAAEPQGEPIPYTEFKQAVVENRVARVTFEGDQIKGVYRGEGEQPAQSFTTVLPSVGDDELLPLLESKGVGISARSAEEPRWFQVLLSVLPWLLIIAFFIYASRTLQQRMSGGR